MREIKGDSAREISNQCIRFSYYANESPNFHAFSRTDIGGITLMSDLEIAKFSKIWVNQHPNYAFMGWYDIRTFQPTANCQDFAKDLSRELAKNAPVANRHMNRTLNETQQDILVASVVSYLSIKAAEYWNREPVQQDDGETERNDAQNMQDEENIENGI